MGLLPEGLASLIFNSPFVVILLLPQKKNSIDKNTEKKKNR